MLRLHTKGHKFSDSKHKAHDGKKGSLSAFQIWRLAYTLLPFNLRSDAVWITLRSKDTVDIVAVDMGIQWSQKNEKKKPNKQTTK